jgi:hypothetical protein
MNPFPLHRRAFLTHSASCVGGAALFNLLGGVPRATAIENPHHLPHFAAKAKRVIYLFQSGGPSHVDLFDYKPGMKTLHGTELPPSIRGTQRVTGMTSGQGSFPVVGPMAEFRPHGKSGLWMSDLVSHTGGIADDITLVKSVHTEAINHDPAITFINTGSQQIGKPSMGAWLSYGLGSLNENFPSYIVLLSQGTGKNPGQPIFSRLWGSGFLPSSHQGVKLRPGSSPVLYLANPDGITPERRRAFLDDLGALNGIRHTATGDPEIEARISAYEMAFRMQTSVPDLQDLSDEPDSIFDLYGPEARKPGSFAAVSASSNSSTAAGTSTSPSASSSPTSAATPTSPRPPS